MDVTYLIYALILIKLLSFIKKISIKIDFNVKNK